MLDRNLGFILFLILIASSISDVFAQTAQREILVRDHGAVFSIPQLSSVSGYDFFRFRTGEALLLVGSTTLEKSIDFWNNYGPVFSIYSPDELELISSQQDIYGSHHLKFQQLINGRKAEGAEIMLHFNPENELQSAGGFFIRTQLENRDYSLRPNPNLPDLQNNPVSTSFERLARIELAKNFPAKQWQTTRIETVVLSKDLINPIETGIYHARKITLTAINSHESFVFYFDVHSGQLVERLQEHCDAMNRQLYNESTSTPPIWEEGDAFPGSLNSARQNLVRTSAEVYNFFRFTFGRDSYDNNGGIMNIVDNASQLTCPNASAGSTAIYFCPGTTSDDVIGHEWAHIYTRNLSGLIYAWESGALNEAFSDIFGEIIDLLNTTGNDTNDGNPRSNCSEPNVRWKMGEDATAFGSNIRDMYNPDCNGDPDAKTSGNYWCSSGDNGGVHTNSGVLNRSFSLLVDGGTLNGVSVAGIGLTKATHIYFQAYSNYLTRVSDYHAAADALELAGNDLLGSSLLNLTISASAPGNSAEVISTNDLNQLQNTLLATRMRTSSSCPDNPVLAQNPPEVCPVGTEDFEVLFSENWEVGTAGWSMTETPSNPGTWDPKPWALETILPDGRSGQGVKAPNPFVGDCVSDLDNGYVDLISPAINLTAPGVDFILSFNHYFSIEDNWDGGALYLSRNGGSPVHINANNFIFNGYPRNLRTSAQGNDNPLAGLGTFTGSDNNSTSGTWGQSQVDLTAAGAQTGDNIQLVWRMSHDGCNGWLGWFLDEVEVGYCIDPSLLPVTYRSFSATTKDQSIVLDWSTQEEFNNAGFTLERRGENERAFTSIAWVPAQAANGDNYQFVDLKVEAETTYFYRLRQLDFDGSESLSTIVSARIDGERSSLFSIYPNPVTAKELTINWSGNQAANFHLYRSDGRLVREFTNTQNGQKLSIKGLPAGIYWLKNGEQVVKLLVQ